MRKLKLFSMLLLLLIGAGQVWGAEEIYKTALFGSSYNSQGISSYSNSWYSTNDGFRVNIENANNSNNAWTYIKMGSKNAASTGTITTNAAIDKAVTKVVLTIDAITTNSINSITLKTSSNGSSWTNAGTFDKSTGAKIVTLSAPAASLYYKIEVDCKKDKNGLISISRVDYYQNTGSGVNNPTGCVAPTFSPAAGTYTSTQSVTISTETKGATIYYTTDGSAPDNTKTEYTEAISVSSTQTIKAIATKSGLDNSSVASAEYKIYPVEHAGTSADPYTVADARNAIDANTGTSNVYVTGKVSNVVGNSLPGWITYDISVDGETTSDQFRVYKGKSTSGNNFTSADDIQVGDVVVVYGSITYYSKESLYEFSSNSQLISLSRVVIVSLYNGANGATKVGDFESGTDALPTTAADVVGWTFDGNWSKDLFASKTNSQAYANGTYFAGGAEEYSGTNLYAIYRRTPTGGSAIYSTQPTPGYPLSLDPATGDLRISANKDLAFIPVGESVTLSAVGGLVTTWTVYDSDLNDITSSFTYTSSSSTSFVFDMPAQEILVEATMCALPAVPSGLSTSLHDGGTRGKTVFSWTAGSGATKYTLTYTKAGSNPVVVSDIANTTYTVNPLAVGEYTWSVKSVNDCGESAAVNGEGFTICPDFAAITPTVGETSSIAQTTATANWTAVAGAAKYTVQIFNGETKAVEYENVNATSKAITGLTANTTYVVKVTAYNACNEASLVGSSVAFTTLKNVYAVSFNANGGTGEIAAVNVTDGEATTLPSSGFTKAGFSLSGWKVNNEGALLEKGASYTVTGAATLYAQWSPNTIKVTYKPNGPTADEVEESFTYGEEYNAKAANTFSREGYQFKHWNNAADGSGDVTLAAGAAYTGTEDIDLYAIWDQLYTVNWIVNGTTKTTQTAIAGTALTTPYSPVVSDCDNSKAFVGWTETQHYTDATDAPNDLFEYANTLTMPVGGATYYAVFANVEEGSELQDKELEITISNFSEITTSYTTKFTHTYSVSASSGNTDINVEAYGVYNNSNGIQMNKEKGTYIKNTDALPGYIKQIKMTWTATGKNSPTLYANANAVASTSSTSLGEQDNTKTEQTINITNPATANYKYFYFDGTTVTGACYMSLLKITYAVEVDATIRTNYATDCNTVLPVCEEPTFNVEEGTYTIVKNVTITTETEGATIYYTTDGSNPATSGTKETYGSTPVRVDHTLTLKAVAVKEDYINSTVKSATYTINLPQCATPTFSVEAGRYTETKSVELSCETEGADIYYTTDGETPTTGSTKYTEAISVATNMTIKAVAIAENTTLSEVASATYKIVGPGSTLWELVESTNDLNDGDIIVIASNTKGKTTNSTITTSNSANYFGEEVATFSEDKSEITELSDDAQQFTLGKSGNYWTLSKGTQYLKETAVKKLAWDNNTFNWAISIDETTHAATISNSNTAGNRILHNVNNTRFTTYSSDLSESMLLPQIYRKTVICIDPETELAFASSVPTAIDASENAQLATTGGNGNTVTYSVISNNASAASIDNENRFSAIAAGTYTVQARQTVSNDYKCAQTTTIDIVVAVAATGIELNKIELSLEESQFETLVATVKPYDASNKNVTWSVTEGSTFIEVDQTGKVTAKAMGNGTVQVETEDGHFIATCAVTVTAPTPTLTLTATNPLAFGNVEPNLTKNLTVNLKGSYLVANAAYSIEGDNVFTVVTELDNDEISSEDGQTLTIRFAPTAEGDKSATITFTCGKATPVVLTVNGTGKKRYTATLHAGNGSVISETIQEATIGSGITLPEATLSQKLQDGGWSFAGWSETELINETAEVPTTIAAGAYAIAADKEFYAVYTRTNIVEKTASKNSGLMASSTEADLETGKQIRWKCSSGNSYSDPLRLYKDESMTIKGKDNNVVINSITFTDVNSYRVSNLTVSTGTLSGATWTGSANSVIFTAGAQVRVSSIAVTYQTSEGLYTTYPAELSAIEFDLNGGTGNFPSQTVVKGSSYTIDAAEPTKPNHDFLGWNDGSTTYQAAETIENIQDDIALTAQWDEWAKATTITFKNGETTVDTKENIYKGASYTTPAAPNVDGKLFQGWSDGVNTYAAETEVTMPDDLTEDITITYNALWQDILPTPDAQTITEADLANGEWVLVTANSQLKEGDVVIIAQAENTESIYAMGDQHVDNNKCWRNQVSVAKSGNKITPTDEVAKLFVQVGYNSKYALYVINGTTGYLFDPQIGSNNYLNTGADLTSAASWNITIDANYIAEIINDASSKKLRYNSTNKDRFSCYSTDANVALYKWVKKISGTMNIEDVTLTDAVIVPNGATLNVPADATLDNLIVENGGIVDIESGTLTVNDLTIESMVGKSGQLLGADDVTVTGNIYMDIKFYSSQNGTTLNETEASQWYMISAPFDVNLADGFINPVSGVTMHRGNDDNVNTFDLFEYDGEKRATTGTTGWKRVSGKMTAGTACLIGFNPGQPTTIRLKAASNTISDPTSITLSTFEPEGSASGDQNWNGVANPKFQYTSVDKDVMVWNNEEGENGRKYITYGADDYSFVVGTHFFVQATGSIDLTGSLNSALRAPKREETKRYSYCVRITREGATEFADQMYVRASEEATNTYEQVHDMITWNGTSGKSALLWSENYGMRLAIEEAPLANNGATYVLGLYAPADGVYTISTPTEDEDATLYLTLNGHIIWNLSQGAYTAELQQGQNSGYGLKIVAAPKVSTDVEQSVVSDQPSVQKVIIDEHVYILRGGQMYDVNGKMVK